MDRCCRPYDDHQLNHYTVNHELPAPYIFPSDVIEAIQYQQTHINPIPIPAPPLQEEGEKPSMTYYTPLNS